MSEPEVFYVGHPRRDTGDWAFVFRNDVPFLPVASQIVYNHSPDGWNWGYGGSGPAQLALGLLLDAVGKEAALKYHQDFKSSVIARIPGEMGWRLSRGDIRLWWASRVGANALAEAEGRREQARDRLEALVNLLCERGDEAAEAATVIMALVDLLDGPAFDPHRKSEVAILGAACLIPPAPSGGGG